MKIPTLGGKDEVKAYSVKYNKCMQYKFLIDTTEGEIKELEIDDNLYKSKKWYNLTKKSLIELGLEPRIKRDNFSRRLHTNVTGTLKLLFDVDGQINSYKDYCKGYWTIDAVTSQPRLLWLHLKEMGISDENLDYVFENDLDFYDFLCDNTEEGLASGIGSFVSGLFGGEVS